MSDEEKAIDNELTRLRIGWELEVLNKYAGKTLVVALEPMSVSAAVYSRGYGSSGANTTVGLIGGERFDLISASVHFDKRQKSCICLRLRPVYRCEYKYIEVLFPSSSYWGFMINKETGDYGWFLERCMSERDDRTMKTHRELVDAAVHKEWVKLNAQRSSQNENYGTW